MHGVDGIVAFELGLEHLFHGIEMFEERVVAGFLPGEDGQETGGLIADFKEAFAPCRKVAVHDRAQVVGC